MGTRIEVAQLQFRPGPISELQFHNYNSTAIFFFEKKKVSQNIIEKKNIPSEL